MGIGGYHLVTKTNATIGYGKFTTTVEARFQYSNAGDEDVYRDKKVNNNNPDDIEAQVQDADEADTCNNVISSIQAQITNAGNVEGE